MKGQNERNYSINVNKIEIFTGIVEAKFELMFFLAVY